MPLTTSPVEVVHALMDICVANQDTLNLGGIFYGDQDKLPANNIVCFEVDTKDSVLNPTRKAKIAFTIYVLVYSARVDSPELNREDADQLGVNLEALFDADPQLNGLLIHGYVSQLASGYSTKDQGRSVVRSCRLTYEGISQTILPS